MVWGWACSHSSDRASTAAGRKSFKLCSIIVCWGSMQETVSCTDTWLMKASPLPLPTAAFNSSYASVLTFACKHDCCTDVARLQPSPAYKCKLSTTWLPNFRPTQPNCAVSLTVGCYCWHSQTSLIYYYSALKTDTHLTASFPGQPR